MREEPLYADEMMLFSRRDLLLKAALSVPAGAIFWRLWDLQVKNGEKYKELSKGNRIRLTKTAAPRGIIYDQSGVILAKNIPSFNLMLVREDAPNVNEVLQKLSTTLRIPFPLIERNLKKFGQGVKKFEPFLVYKDLTWYQMALVNAYQEEFPGISIETSPRRYFPLLESGAHLLGYMNRITKSQLQELPANKVMSARVVGQEGIEKIYNPQLIGTDGGEQVEVNSTGRILKRIEALDPEPGKDLVLSVDSRLQKKIENVLEGKKASCIIMNPHDGEVYSMVSTPSFDPNEFSMGMSNKRWQEILNHPDHPLNNKCIQGSFSPGSTFKMAVALAALNEGVVNEETVHVCEGVLHYNDLTIHCWKRSGHGDMTVTDAIEHSCNIFFYKCAIELGVDKIHEYATMMGLGDVTGVDLSGEKSGTIPSKAWKKERYGDRWYPGETLPVAIGQGYVSTTPMQLLNYVNVIANGGHLVKPKLVRRILKTPAELEEYFRLQKEEIEKELSHDRKPLPIKKEAFQIVKRAMFLNVNGHNGTGRSAQSEIFEMAGKTGTTQVVSNRTKWRLKKEKGFLEERFYDHAWFVGFAPAQNPKISVVLLLENGKAGSNAARKVKEILEYYFTEIDPVDHEQRGIAPKKTMDQA